MLFGERGFERTAVSEVASRAGVATGGFYAHFRTKRQALLVLMDRFVAEMDALAVDPGAARSPAAAVEALVREGLAVDRVYAGAYRAWRELSLRDPELAELDAALERWTAARVADLLRQLHGAPGVRSDVDPEAMARVLTLLFWRLAEAPVQDPERTWEAVAQLVRRTLLHD